MTSAAVDGGGSVGDYASNGVELIEQDEIQIEYPAVIVESVPATELEQGYAAQIVVYDDETFMMQDVAEEQEVETETVEIGLHFLLVVMHGVLETMQRWQSVSLCTLLNNNFHNSLSIYCTEKIAGSCSPLTTVGQNMTSFLNKGSGIPRHT